MKPFNVTLTQIQANLIFNALNSYLSQMQNESNKLIQYLDSEFKKANMPPEPQATDDIDDKMIEQPQ